MKKVDSKICIFIDEIDKILDLDKEGFQTDNFFGFIRYIHNFSANDSDFERLNFVVLGVATPSDLIVNKERTPFNIGKKITLKNFSLNEAKLFLPGLAESFDDPEKVLRDIFLWTGGQPYLTQKFCKLSVELCKARDCDSTDLIANIAENNFIRKVDTEANLTNIRNRILKSEDYALEMLTVLRRIHRGEIFKYDPTNISHEYLKLTGIVNNKGNKLSITNKLYKEVFNLKWVDHNLSTVRFPFAKDLILWQEKDEDEKFLLKEQNLNDALLWSDGNKNISEIERDFITKSRDLKDHNDRIFRKGRAIIISIMAITILGLMGVSLYLFYKSNELVEQKMSLEKIMIINDSLLVQINAEQDSLKTKLNVTIAQFQIDIDSFYRINDTKSLEFLLAKYKSDNKNLDNQNKRLRRENTLLNQEKKINTGRINLMQKKTSN